MSELSIDYQDVREQCGHCGSAYTVSRGSVYDQGEVASIYLAALHQCEEGRVAHFAIAIREGYEGIGETCAAVLQVRNGGENFELSLVDPDYSPWNGAEYLGRIMTRKEVLESAAKEIVFHIADHVVIENPTISSYLLA